VYKRKYFLLEIDSKKLRKGEIKLNISEFMTNEEKEMWEMEYQSLKDLIYVLQYLTGDAQEQFRQHLQEGFRQLGFTKAEIFSMIPPRP